MNIIDDWIEGMFLSEDVFIPFPVRCVLYSFQKRDFVNSRSRNLYFTNTLFIDATVFDIIRFLSEAN